MPFDALKFFLPVFTVLFALGISSPTCPANAQSPAPKQGLNFVVGSYGLD